MKHGKEEGFIQYIKLYCRNMMVTSNEYFIFVIEYDTKSKHGDFKWPLESPTHLMSAHLYTAFKSTKTLKIHHFNI
jgi:hypothetical protein